MTVAVANLTTSNTFGQWLTLTNTLAALMSANVVTVGGTPAVGNSVVQGTHTANTLAADVLTGISGNTTVENVILIIDTTASLVTNGGVTINGGFTANIVVVNGNTTLSNGTMFVDATTNQVGINTLTPTAALFVNGAIGATGDIKGFQSSDKNLKEHIRPIDPAEAEFLIMALDAVEFDWRTDVSSDFVRPKMSHDYSWIAQELETLKPDWVEKRPDGYFAINRDPMVPILWAMMRNLIVRIRELENVRSN